jgi:hypothetical protein
MKSHGVLWALVGFGIAVAIGVGLRIARAWVSAEPETMTDGHAEARIPVVQPVR